MATEPSSHGLAPAEQYLRAFWHARYYFLLIVALFVGGAMVVNTLLPKVYSSQALLSVRQSPQIDSAGLLYDTVLSSRSQSLNEYGETLSRRVLRRLHAVRTATLAARDAGAITATESVDEGQINSWVELELIEKTDLIVVTINQPTAERAQRLAQALIVRALQEAREENAATETRTLLNAQIERAAAEVAAAEKREAEVTRAAPGAIDRMAQARAIADLDVARRNYAGLKKRFDILDLTLAEQQFRIYVVDPPTLPLRPSFPRPLLNVGIGLILGILAGTLLVVLRGIFAGEIARRA